MKAGKAPVEHIDRIAQLAEDGSPEDWRVVPEDGRVDTEA